MYSLRLIGEAGCEVCGAAAIGDTALRQLAALTFVSVSAPPSEGCVGSAIKSDTEHPCA
jgi:hypothetical protein